MQTSDLFQSQTSPYVLIFTFKSVQKPRAHKQVDNNGRNVQTAILHRH